MIDYKVEQHKGATKMTENYEQELKLIEAVEKSRGMEWIDELENFGNYFNPAHMRQRIEREMAKDRRILELENALGTLVALKAYKEEYGKDGHYLGHQPKAWMKAMEILK